MIRRLWSTVGFGSGKGRGTGGTKERYTEAWSVVRRPKPTVRGSLAQGRKPVHECVELCVLPPVV